MISGQSPSLVPSDLLWSVKSIGQHQQLKFEILRLLPYHEFWAIDSFTGLNEIYLFWLKVIVITKKVNVVCKKLRSFSKLYIGSRYRQNCVGIWSTHKQRFYLIRVFRWSITTVNYIRLPDWKVETPMAGVQLENIFRLKNDRLEVPFFVWKKP